MAAVIAGKQEFTPLDATSKPLDNNNYSLSVESITIMQYVADQDLTQSERQHQEKVKKTSKPAVVTIKIREESLKDKKIQRL